MMNPNKYILLFLCLAAAVSGLYCQEEEQLPDWVRLENGKRLFDDGKFGDALLIFQKLREKTDSYPEADYWIGRVFEEEGELGLAESQYLRALDAKKDLYVYQDVLHIQNRLARIYRIGRKYHEYEDILKSSIRFAGGDSISDANRLFPLMVRTLKEKGIDKLFELYRLDESMVLHAHSELGLFYYRTGRYEESIRNLIVAVLTILSRTAEEVKYYDPLFESLEVEGLLNRALKFDNIREYTESTSFFPALYYLGASLYAVGEIRESRELFTIVSGQESAGEWAALAMRQLTDPFIEPVLTSDEYFYF